MPRPPKYSDPRRHILDAAKRLIVDQGFDKVSLRAVARAADFSPAGLYEYFSNKSELFVALAEEANLALASALRRAVEREPPGDPAALVSIGLAYVAFAHDEPEQFLLLFSRQRSQRQSLSQQPPSGSAYGVVLAAVDACIKAGTLAQSDKELFGYAIWSAAHGAAMLQLTNLRDFDADFGAGDRFMFETLVGGMRG